MSGEKKLLILIGIITLILVVVGSLFLGKSKKTENAQTVDQAQLLDNARNTIGDPNAPVKIVAFSDFQCPAGAAAFPIVKSILSKNQDQIYFVFKYFPISAHKNSRPAAQAAEAAAKQGKFWEMHDMLFKNQREWENSADPKQIFTGYAQKLELDTQKYDEDFDNVIAFVNQDFSQGQKVGVNSTPTFFINGQKYPGVIPEGQFQQIIDSITGFTQEASI